MAVDAAVTSVLRTRLLAHLHETSDRLAAVTALRGPRSAGDGADDVVGHVLADWAHVHRAELRRTARAFLATEAGTYGRCRRCGDALALTSITADPAADRCERCQPLALAPPGAGRCH